MRPRRTGGPIAQAAPNAAIQPLTCAAPASKDEVSCGPSCVATRNATPVQSLLPDDPASKNPNPFDGKPPGVEASSYNAATTASPGSRVEGVVPESIVVDVSDPLDAFATSSRGPIVRIPEISSSSSTHDFLAESGNVTEPPSPVPTR